MWGSISGWRFPLHTHVQCLMFPLAYTPEHNPCEQYISEYSQIHTSNIDLLRLLQPIKDHIQWQKHYIKFSFVSGAWNWLNCCSTSSLIEQIIGKFCQLNPDRKLPVTSRLNPACWSASFTLCLIRIVTFFNVAPSERAEARWPRTN